MATHFAGTKQEEEILSCYIVLMRAADSLTSRLGPAMEAGGLTWSQFGALEALQHLGPLAQCELARKLLRSGGNITMVVDNLEKRGLVRRKRNEADRRSVTVSITEEGSTVIRAAFRKHLEAVKREFSILNSDELGELRRICKIVGLQKR